MLFRSSGGADKNLDSQRALERSSFVYSYEKKSIALKVFHQTNSVSETIRILGYPTRRQWRISLTSFGSSPTFFSTSEKFKIAMTAPPFLFPSTVIMFFTAVKSYFHTLAVSLPAPVSAVCGTPVSDFPVHHRMLRRCCR